MQRGRGRLTGRQKTSSGLVVVAVALFVAAGLIVVNGGSSNLGIGLSVLGLAALFLGAFIGLT